MLFRWLNENRKLEVLNLNECMIGELHAYQLIKGLTQTCNLRTLILAGNYLKNETFLAFGDQVAHGKCVHLKKIDFSENNLMNDSAI